MITEEQLEALISYKTIYKYTQDYSFNLFDEKNINIIKDCFNEKHKFRTTFGIFGLPTKEFLIWFSNYISNRKVYDLGAGTGYLSYGLKKINKNLEITAIDNYSTSYYLDQSKPLNKIRKWFNVKNENVEDIIKDIKNSIVIINWPDYDSDFAYNIASNLSKTNELIYIGEHSGGCTANDKFFENFTIEQIYDEWFSWTGIHDTVFKVNI